ncbi:AMP-binding protein [Corynebacterium tapiri]|uniref:AMP-binding protein n=1 Tax=Corynebacterium tapiri TaxID=1448266 RepID=A0A5C4U350_9CORY|nr:AMP-binding protein [Corynebacterium tapiri]
MSDAAFTASTVAKNLPVLFRNRLIDLSAPPKATLSLVPGLARYWFTLAREFELAYATCPDRIGLIDDDGTLTYRQLREQARTIARFLLSLGEDELHIGIMARNGRGIILPMAAKGYAGATLYLLNVGSSPEQLLGCIEENNINVLFVDDEFADRVPQRPGLNVIYAHQAQQRNDHVGINHIVRHPEDYRSVSLPTFPRHGGIILMSSGTSGVPKGVVRPEPKLPTVLGGVMRAIPWRADVRVQMTASMFHTWGWSMINIAFAARATVITQRVFDAENCLRQIERYRVEGLVSSPIFFKQMLQVPGNEQYDTSSLDFIASSGNALTPALVEETIERFGPILCNIYGSTELTLAASATAEEIAADPTIAGHISTGTRLKILDKNGKEVPNGQIGRVFLRNNTSLTGYTNPNIPIIEEQGLIQMGDLGYLDENNMLHVLGRIDDMIIVGGENVYPRSVEEILEPMPGIKDLTAKGVDDPDTFQRIAVWVVRDETPAGQDLSEDSVRAWVADHLADHSIPRDVHFVDELPRNATGKVMPRML